MNISDFIFLPLTSFIGTILCGSKIFLLIIIASLIFIVRPFIRFIFSQRIKKYTLFYLSISAFLSIPFLSLVLTSLANNPLVRTFFNFDSSSISLYHLTAGRVSLAGEIHNLDGFSFSALGLGYHTIIYDNGFLYLLFHVGFIGFFFFIGSIYFALIHPLYGSLAPTVSSLALDISSIILVSCRPLVAQFSLSINPLCSLLLYFAIFHPSSVYI